MDTQNKGAPQIILQCTLQRVKKVPNTRVIPNQCRSTGVGIPRMNVEITGLGTKIFEIPGIVTEGNPFRGHDSLRTGSQ